MLLIENPNQPYSARYCQESATVAASEDDHDYHDDHNHEAQETWASGTITSALVAEVTSSVTVDSPNFTAMHAIGIMEVAFPVHWRVSSR